MGNMFEESGINLTQEHCKSIHQIMEELQMVRPNPMELI
jgi:hypothetical protein